MGEFEHPDDGGGVVATPHAIQACRFFSQNEYSFRRLARSPAFIQRVSNCPMSWAVTWDPGERLTMHEPFTVTVIGPKSGSRLGRSESRGNGSSSWVARRHCP